MNARPLAIITTRLPPQVCGIGSYSSELQRHWPEGWQPVEFLVMETVADSERTEQNSTAFNGNAAELAQALERIGAGDVVLHYTARAYHRFGCPIWLPGVLMRWKQKFSGGRLMMIVHEVAGQIPITSPHYWLARIDAWIIRRVARLADVLVTNTEHHHEKLRSISGRDDIHSFPVASNIPVAPRAATARAATEFVIFGLPFRRLHTLQKFEPDIRRWHAAGRLTKLHLIGPDGDELTKRADALIGTLPQSISVTRHGRLLAAEVSRVLSSTQFALTDVTAETWSKSGAFMACAAHRCLPVVAGADHGPVPLSFAISPEQLETITADGIERRASALAQWYDENAAWPVIAARMAALLQKESPARVG